MFSDFSSHIDLGGIVVENRRQRNNLHHSVPAAVHSHAVYFVSVNDCHVKVVLEIFIAFLKFHNALSYDIVLIFERAIDFAVSFVNVETA